MRPRSITARPQALLIAAAGLAALGGCGPGCGTAPGHDAGPGSPLAALASGATERLDLGTVRELRAPAPPRILYRISVPRGDFLHVAAEQLGVDVALTLRDASGRAVVSVDSPNSEWGPEHLYFVADQSGPFLLEVRQLSAARGGRCSLRIADLRPATPADRTRAAACLALSDADAVQTAATPAARRLGAQRYQQAILIWRSLGDLSQEAIAETKLGSAWSRLGEMPAAVSHWERAADLLRQRGLEQTLPALRNDLGTGYQRLGDVERARSSYETALAASRARGDRREEVAALTNLGHLEQSAGRPWSALALFDEALAGWRQVGDRAGEAMTLQDQGLVYTVLGKLSEARAALEQAAELFRSTEDRRRQAATAMALGWVRFLEGDADAARRDLGRALLLERADGDRRGEAVVLDRLGSLGRETGDFKQAAADYRQALAIFHAVGDRLSEAITQSNLGLALTRGGDPTAGLLCEQAALPVLASLRQLSAEAYARFRLALAERALGRLEAARQDMEHGLTGLESIRNEARSADLRMSYLDSVYDQYENLVDLLMELHAKQPAAGFDRAAASVAERSRARSLLDLVGGARHRGRESEGPATARLRAVDERIRDAEAQVEALRGRAGVGQEAPRSSQLRLLLAERQKILVELRPPGGAGIPPPRVLGSGELGRLLGPDTVLLLYSLGESRSFLWAMSAQGMQSAVLPSRVTLEDAARRYHDLLVHRGSRGAAAQEKLTARELSRVLLGPIASALAGRRIAVVPDGALAYVPFAALPEPEGDGAPLLARHEVVVLPSASVLAAIRRRSAGRPPAPRLLAVVADPLLRPPSVKLAAARPDLAAGALARGPAIASSEPSITRSARDLGLAELEPLIYSRREAEAILALVPPGQGFAALGARASRDLTLGGWLRQFRILHFATHSLIHPSAPELSGIVLSVFDAQGRCQPGFLRSYEISDLSLGADLVVLSACRTGLGQEVRGEGLLGFTQSFFQAGAARVIVSLWNVDDLATAQLMQRFYQELLRGGRAPAAALRIAQLSLRDDPRWAAPFYWAGFELQGDWRPLT